MSTIQGHLFRRSQEPFCELLRQNSVEFSRRIVLANQVQNSADIIHIVLSAAVLTPLALVAREWIRSRATRKFQITLKDDSISLLTEGMSQEQIKGLLKEARSFAAIDTSAPEPTEVPRPPLPDGPDR